ncbi:hypothetical protein [uncultured Thiohalocapsa sp.]|uniref:hypothetical protein n=1 Tax=uncultured Thiohalocapsa sp. TaxID=768990 RepID=UPI0025ECD9D4|nr:hypothetical protein [uncultured Thiohalocapsa sp.]
MQAIEFETHVSHGSVSLPADAQVADGQQVRVVILFERAEQAKVSAAAEKAQTGPIARLMQNPLLVPGFAPLSRDEAHAR